MRAILAPLLAAVAAALPSPTGLLCDYQQSPALGVRGAGGDAPAFTWIVPPCPESPDAVQTAYQLVVTSEGAPVWDSGRVASDESTYARYAGPPLNASTRYVWTVATWAGACASAPSAPALFVPALPVGGWDVAARWVSVGRTAGASSIFGYFRKDVVVPAGTVAAVASLTALTTSELLCGYKLYVDGALVDVGPGRSEAPVWRGAPEPSAFRALNFQTLDVTATLPPGPHTLALQAMYEGLGGATALLQVVFRAADGAPLGVVGSDASWAAFDGDAHRRPAPPAHGHSAGTAFLENIDARAEPVGWRAAGFVPGAGWAPANATPLSATDVHTLHARMEPPMQVVDLAPAALRTAARPPAAAASFIGTFAREFQGGLRLAITGGAAGTVVNISCGEALVNDTVSFTWGWEFAWTLRDGDQELEQHKYMECRFVRLDFSAPAPAFTLSAWQVSYPWRDEESAFASDNATLDAVYDLCRYTLHAVSLDTYTDSNTRERRVYEADGLIAESGRLLVQRDVLFARHSHSYVFQHPTWPIEWFEMRPFLAWQDFYATGQPDLALAYEQELYGSAFLPYVDATGVLRTDNASMGRAHIIDWEPDVNATRFTPSAHMSVTNFFAARGLDMLAQMLGAGGASNASAVAATAAALRAAIVREMWNGTAFCDGICAEVDGKALVVSQMFALAMGLVEPAAAPGVWRAVAAGGLEGMGVYASFFYFAALGQSYYSGAAPFDAPDDGTAIVTALTKCDFYSWCSGLRDDNLTLTREAWHEGTYSHGWGTSPLVAVSWGVLGVRQTAPGWAAFTVMPKLGPLTRVAGTIPTLRGFINLTAGPGTLDVAVPCNTAATLCSPRAATDAPPRLTTAAFALTIDGEEVVAVERAGHLCAAAPLGCGAGGAPRAVRTRARAAAMPSLPAPPAPWDAVHAS